MKIDNSVVTMSSSRHYESYEHTEAVMYNGVAGNSEEGIAVSMKQISGKNAIADAEAAVLDLQKNNEQDKKQAEKERYLSQLQTMAERAKANKNNSVDLSIDKDGKLQMLKKLLAALRNKGKLSPEDLFDKDGKSGIDLRSSGFKMSEMFSSTSAQSLNFSVMSTGTANQGTMWQKVTATSSFFAETESTSFATQGIVRTSDGRDISFNVEVSMSRGFARQIDVVSKQNYVFTDPLVINLDTNATSVSDFKIGFDLDSDGKEEEISFAGQGSGFIALDKNNDGKINDGSELFGTSSGDGFKDLAEYDEDGNGWIDENDSIFNKLKVWTKDANGNDHLDSLKSMDVGAIYLGNVGTEFSLNDDNNVTNAVVRKTGIYLKESGGAGTVNHIDLAT